MLSGFLPIYQNKLQKEGAWHSVNINKMKFEPYGELVDSAFSQFNENLINNQDPDSQIKNDETSGTKYPNGSDTEKGGTNKTFAIPNFSRHKYYQLIKS